MGALTAAAEIGIHISFTTGVLQRARIYSKEVTKIVVISYVAPLPIPIPIRHRTGPIDTTHTHIVQVLPTSRSRYRCPDIQVRAHQPSQVRSGFSIKEG